MLGTRRTSLVSVALLVAAGVSARSPVLAQGQVPVDGFYKGRIAHWQTPDDVVFVDELPHTATGKLSKLTLRGKYKDWLVRKGS